VQAWQRAMRECCCGRHRMVTEVDSHAGRVFTGIGKMHGVGTADEARGWALEPYETGLRDVGLNGS
jgi:hypothetical protein